MLKNLTISPGSNGGVVVQTTLLVGKSERRATTKESLRNNINLRPKTGILPPVVRWISLRNHAVLLERAPHIASARYYGVKKDRINESRTLQHYALPMPWTLYAIRFGPNFRPTKVRLYAMSGPISSYDDELAYLPLPNVYLNGDFCTPARTEWFTGDTTAWTLAQGIDAAFDLVWGSGFNTDIIDQVDYAYRNRSPEILFKDVPQEERVKPANIFVRWERLSLTDAVSATWRPANYTVGELISELHEEECGTYTKGLIATQMRTAR